MPWRTRACAAQWGCVSHQVLSTLDGHVRSVCLGCVGSERGGPGVGVRRLVHEGVGAVLLRKVVFGVVLIGSVHWHLRGVHEQRVSSVERSEVVKVAVEFFWSILVVISFWCLDVRTSFLASLSVGVLLAAHDDRICSN